MTKAKNAHTYKPVEFDNRNPTRARITSVETPEPALEYRRENFVHDLRKVTKPDDKRAPAKS